NISWSSFVITVVNDNMLSSSSSSSSSSSTTTTTTSSSSSSTSSTSSNMPINYGSEVILSDPTTGFISDPLIICKVEKNHILQNAIGPVSQMQKIALQRVTRRQSPFCSSNNNNNNNNND